VTSWEGVLTGLVQQRGTALKRYGYLLCGDSSEAEDLVQDALVRTFSSARRADVGQVEGYVRTVMLRLYLDRTRRRNLWRRIQPLAAPAPQPDQHAYADLRGDLGRALRELSARQRACVVLYYYLDLPVQECADLLDLKPGAVKRYLYEARSRLAERLGPPEPAREEH
jgi:RNA polymerase sigma factor (sigma-70 family)